MESTTGTTVEPFDNNLYTVAEATGEDETGTMRKYRSVEVEPMPSDSGSQTYVTPAIKKWYTYCGLCPAGVTFTPQEKLVAIICKWSLLLHTKILAGPAVYCVAASYGVEEFLRLCFSLVWVTGWFFFADKVKLVIETSIDAREVIRDPDDCKKLHGMAKKFNIPFPVLLLKSLFRAYMVLLAYFPLYSLLRDKRYGMASIVLLYFATGVPVGPSLVYSVFSKAFIARKNEIEIKSYLATIEDIVLDSKKVISPEDSMKLLRKHQAVYEYRMKERKKSFSYHSRAILAGTLAIVFILIMIIMRERTSKKLLEVATYSLALFFLVVSFWLIYMHASQIVMGPVIFQNASEKLKYLDFMKGVETKFNLRYDIFEKFWLREQKKMVTVNVLGLPMEREAMKKIVFAMTSLFLASISYMARDIIIHNEL